MEPNNNDVIADILNNAASLTTAGLDSGKLGEILKKAATALHDPKKLKELDTELLCMMAGNNLSSLDVSMHTKMTPHIGKIVISENNKPIEFEDRINFSTKIEGKDI